MAITDDPYFQRELVPEQLARLSAALRARWALASGATGIKGDEDHKRGYHRSREFNLYSPYCINRTYSVTETVGNRIGGDARWLAGMDISLPDRLLLGACQRLDEAVRAGRLEKVTEWYGNKDGDTRVDGYDNIHNAIASSDSSHLWHMHISFDRGRVNEDHSDLYAILTGDTDVITDDDVERIAKRAAELTWRQPVSSPSLDRSEEYPNGRPHSTHETVINSISTNRMLAALAGALTALAENAGAEPSEVLAAIEAGARGAVLDALAAGVGEVVPAPAPGGGA